MALITNSRIIADLSRDQEKKMASVSQTEKRKCREEATEGIEASKVRDLGIGRSTRGHASRSNSLFISQKIENKEKKKRWEEKSVETKR